MLYRMPNFEYSKFIKNENGNINWISILLFLISLIIIGFILYFVIKTVVGEYKNTMNSEQWLIPNTSSATGKKIIDNKKIPRSNDGKYGIEFSYSVWIYIDDWDDQLNNDNKGKLHHILHKGDADANPNQAPGIWLQQDNTDLKLIFKMNTFNKVDDCTGEECYLEKCEIGNIPLNKWFHLTYVTINKNIDLYINGFLKKRCILKGLPRQNEGNVYINSFGGFKGFLSRVRYFNYSLPLWKIEQLMKEGPSEYVGPDLTKAVPPYLSYNWWIQKFGIPSSSA